MEIIVIAIIVGVVILLGVIISAMSAKKKLNNAEGRSKNEGGEGADDSSSDRSLTIPYTVDYPSRNTNNPSSQNVSSDVYSSLLYYVNLDGTTYGPFSLEQLKTYPLLEETLITTNNLNGTWYEAKYFECLDVLFRPNLPFRIDADGTIIRQ